jgi:DNA gyrase subunit A
MTLERPDLSQLPPEVQAYIEALESELSELRAKNQADKSRDSALEASEPPTSLNVVTVSRKGWLKRTPRHLYTRQRRGGMGIFDLEGPQDDPPAFLTVADQAQSLLIITNQARAFRLPVQEISETPVRSRGQALAEAISLNPTERPALILPVQSQGYLNLISERGQARRLRYNIFKESMSPGTTLYDLNELGQPAAAGWSSGEDDLFLATAQGRAIRFAEQAIPPRGCLALRLVDNDQIVAVTAVNDNSGVFLLSADGKGIIRRMSGFAANKSPGSSGKTALKTDRLVGALTVGPDDDIFIISGLSKIIRFPAAEVSTTEGVVQGVNCIALRADEAVAMAGSA